MAEIYDMDGNEVTVGLQGSAVCDEAILTAQFLAGELEETLRLEDDGEVFNVSPSGEITEGEHWDDWEDRW